MTVVQMTIDRCPDNDAIFPSTSRYGFPDLRPDMLCEAIPDEVIARSVGAAELTPNQCMVWVAHSKRYVDGKSGGGLLFYVDDTRLEPLWTRRAEQVVSELRRRGLAWAASVDFSTWVDDPVAVQIWNVYRSRWLARYWQESGIRILPSLSWSDDASHEWCFEGIPRGAPVVMAQARTVSTAQEMDRFRRGLRAAVRAINPGHIVLYAADASWVGDVGCPTSQLTPWTGVEHGNR